MASWIPKIVYGSGPTTYVFPDPPSGDPLGENITPDVDETISNTGSIQTQYNYTAQQFKITFTFLASSDIASLRTWYDTCAKLGNSFQFYPSNEVGTYYTLYLLKPKTFKPVRMFADGSGDFIYQLDLVFTRNYI